MCFNSYWNLSFFTPFSGLFFLYVLTLSVIRVYVRPVVTSCSYNDHQPTSLLLVPTLLRRPLVPPPFPSLRGV